MSHWAGSERTLRRRTIATPSEVQTENVERKAQIEMLAPARLKLERRAPDPFFEGEETRSNHAAFASGAGAAAGAGCRFVFAISSSFDRTRKHFVP